MTNHNDIDVKSEPELRHALAHLWYAIDALAEGCPKVAQMELQSISSIIFWSDDSNPAIEKYLERGCCDDAEEEDEEEKELQGQEELPRQEAV